jgi:hypothetical protein
LRTSSAPAGAPARLIGSGPVIQFSAQKRVLRRKRFFEESASSQFFEEAKKDLLRF